MDILLANEELVEVKEPLISDAICAELDTKVFPNSVSAVDILLANEEDVEVNEPLISDPICAELDTILVPAKFIPVTVTESPDAG